jgi:hypothetical protein
LNRAEYRALFVDMLAAERIAGKKLDVYKRIDAKHRSRALRLVVKVRNKFGSR